ncbi:MAG: T9SS type A sorting domain-containing protein [Flavobacteriales bacterium]|nr:T9SS type A sorting domain-containing protein [Flavobacteriales bacterium]MBK6944026.1 T9SS type A sorting domain-containing protein [Flavobacteriales bacterium]MBK7240232.1 T9SS type A sorting domain-containing protein [Flavobacteriales bacterium]MBK7295486.1 T9SS type A sorting domain-containing protein [Flavobacteriales bacterium]MBK9533694.1 T9SS type A sorting domain-containing protein [Flavobacteriales bacterium]
MRISLLQFATIVGISATAQTLTSTTNIPVATITYNTGSTLYVEPTPPGPDQTWDFSTLSSPGTGNHGIALASTTNNASSFPTSNWAIHTSGGIYEYCEVNAAGWFKIGAFTSSDNSLAFYDDSEMILSFPCSYNTTWTDEWSGTYGASSASRTGTITCVADGYGELVMPYGTVSNVLRVKRTEDYIDQHGNTPYRHIYINHMFYKPGVLVPYVTLSDETITVYNTVTSHYERTLWLRDAPLQMEEGPFNAIGIDLYPNPTTNSTKLVYSGVGYSMQLELTDLMGRLLRNEQLTNTANGVQIHDLDVSTLPVGIYQLRIYSKDGQQGTKRLIVQ